VEPSISSPAPFRCRGSRTLNILPKASLVNSSKESTLTMEEGKHSIARDWRLSENFRSNTTFNLDGSLATPVFAFMATRDASRFLSSPVLKLPSVPVCAGVAEK
jgi:hypothetical protein